MTKKTTSTQKKMDPLHSDPALIITTISDLHGQLEPTYIWGSDGILQKRGGISRLAAHVHKIKDHYPEKMLLFGSGDFFIEDFNRGAYFLTCGPESIAYFLNALPIDASTIGNHEFDFGITAADKALLSCSFPIIATNLRQSDLSRHILKKLIIEKNGYKIGILGAILSEPFLKAYHDILEIDKTGHIPLQFEPDLYRCIQTAVDELKNVDHVDFVIVLSHIGIEEDRKLAEQVHGIDLICGGHTHTAGCETIHKADKTTTVISHSGYLGISLGMIKLWPKENGQLKFECDVIAVDDSIPEDQKFEEKLQSYKKMLPGSAPVVTSTCPIDTTKQALRKRENGFANFVADVIREYFGSDIVLMNARSISSEQILPPGNITQHDMENFFPFDNDYLIRLKATGKQIRQALELGAADIKGNSRNLLHVSGLHYTIDASKPALIALKNEEGMIIGSTQDGSRIVRADSEHHKLFQPLDDNHVYDVIINNMMIDEFFYLAEFYMLKSIKDKQNTGLTQKDILLKYFIDHPIISPNHLGRLKIIA